MRELNMQQIVAKSAFALALVLAAPALLAQSIAPDILLRSVTEEVIGQIKQDADLQAGDPVKVAALVATAILPLFDFNRMTQSAMARNWRLASLAQQRALVDEFRTLLLRTYSSALVNYRDEVIEFKRLRAAPGATAVTVKSDVKRSGREMISLDYDMENTPAGWRIYDVKVAGVRMVSSHREAFAERIREGGVEGLIKSLSDMNRQRENRFKSVKASTWEKSRLMYAILRSMWQPFR